MSVESGMVEDVWGESRCIGSSAVIRKLPGRSMNHYTKAGAVCEGPYFLLLGDVVPKASVDFPLYTRVPEGREGGTRAAQAPD
jgi:hypothetical protein